MTDVWMICTDLHIPYQDDAALGCFKHAVQTVKPTGVVVIGDFIDCGPFGKHEPKTIEESQAYDFKKAEIDPANRLLDYFQKYTKKLVYLEGNHEARIEKSAARHGRLLQSVYPLLSPRNLLGSGRKNFTWVPYLADPKKSLHSLAPGLYVCHGLSTSKYAATRHVERLKHYSCFFGHTHRCQWDTRRDTMKDDVHFAISSGCLSALQPFYMHSAPTEWVHGFGIVYVRKGKPTPYTVLIEHGEATLPGGKLVRG